MNHQPPTSSATSTVVSLLAQTATLSSPSLPSASLDTASTAADTVAYVHCHRTKRVAIALLLLRETKRLSSRQLAF